MRLFLIILLFLTTNIKFKSNDIVGYWQDSSKELIVYCYERSGEYYGKIKWFHNPNKNKTKYSEDGLPKSKWLDQTIMSNFKFDNEKWIDGKIFDIKYGKEYDAKIEMINKNKISVRGYVLISIIGQDITFNRYEGKLPKQE